MFGDPIENPMRYNVGPLENLIVKGPQNGLYKPKSYYGAGTRILRIDSFYDGRATDPSSWQRVRLDDATIEKFALLEDDIIVNRVNSRPFLGKSAIIPNTEEPTVFESNMMRMEVDTNRILPKFLISILRIGSIKQQLCLNAKDAINQSSINQTDVRRLSVIVPPLDHQRRYTQIAETVRLMAAFLESGSRTASELSASLMSRLMEAKI